MKNAVFIIAAFGGLSWTGVSSMSKPEEEEEVDDEDNRFIPADNRCDRSKAVLMRLAADSLAVLLLEYSPKEAKEAKRLFISLGRAGGEATWGSSDASSHKDDGGSRN